MLVKSQFAKFDNIFIEALAYVVRVLTDLWVWAVNKAHQVLQ